MLRFFNPITNCIMEGEAPAEPFMDSARQETRPPKGKLS
jgi:hypothetical protein